MCARHVHIDQAPGFHAEICAPHRRRHDPRRPWHPGDEQRAVGTIGGDTMRRKRPRFSSAVRTASLRSSVRYCARLVDQICKKCTCVLGDGIEFAVTHAAAGAHALNVAGSNGSSRLPMESLVERARPLGLANDLHIAMSVGPKPAPAATRSSLMTRSGQIPHASDRSNPRMKTCEKTEPAVIRKLYQHCVECCP